MAFPQPGETVGRYRIDRVLGQGGMGIVYAATDTRLDRPVAIKVITGALAHDPEFVARFHDEATTLSRLDSPYVIAILDHDEHEELPYIVTQYVDGTDLDGLLKERGALPAREALTICAQVARGLGDAHRAGVVHRDVKPGNVLLRAPGTPEVHAYVIDFGIARSDDSRGRTQAGMVAGTWAYLAPERAQGAPATPSSDIYALGCLLWTCLTGSIPFHGTEVEMAMAHANAPVPQLPARDPFTAQVNEVLARLLAKDPAARYPDAPTARAAIEQLLATAPGGVVAAAPAPVDPTVPRRRAATTAPSRSTGGGRRRWPLIAAAVTALVLGVGGGATWAVLAADDDAPDAGASPDTEPVVASDLDGDGLGDVPIQQTRLDAPAPLPVWTLPSDGTQFTSPTTAPGATGVARRADLDGDGRDEVVWIDKSDDDTELTVTTAGEDGDPEVRTATVDPALELEAYNAALAEVTGDDVVDLVVRGEGENATIYVAVGDEDGFGEPEPWHDTDFDGSYGMIWPGDFDGDGSDEVLFFTDDEEAEGRYGAVFTLAPNDAHDAFEVVAERPVRSTFYAPGYLVTWLLGDADGDGADEVVVIGATGQRISVIDVVDGELGDLQTWATDKVSDAEARERLSNSPTKSWGLSDVDGDGDVDLVELRQPRGDVIAARVHESDGTSFADPVGWGGLPCGSDCTDGFVVVP